MSFSADSVSNAMTIVALLLAGALLLLNRLMKDAKSPLGIQPFAAMPTPKGSNFILGNLLQIRPLKLHLIFASWANELGGIYRVRVLNQNIIVITDPKIFQPLLTAGDDALPKHGMYQEFDLFESPNSIGVDSGNVFTTFDFHDEKFKIARKELAMAFSMKQMKEVAVPSLNATGRSLADKWGAEGIIEIDHDLDAAILDHILDSSFKFNLSRSDKGDFLQRLAPALAEVSERVANPIRVKLQRLLPFLPWSQRIKKVMKGCYNIWDMIYDQIKANAPYADTDMSFSACLWRIEDTHGFPRFDSIGNIVNMAIAGFETSSGAIAWALYDVASNPEVQSKLHTELKSAGLIHSANSKGRPITWEDLSLPYLNAVVKESARINPVGATGTQRVTYKDTAIGGYWVPKGAMVAIQPAAIHTSIHNWEDPLSFKPDRWLEGGKANDNPAFIPFSLGPRSCLGQNMAYVTVRVILLELLSRLQFEVDPCMGSRSDVRANQVMKLTMKHDGGIKLIAKKL